MACFLLALVLEQVDLKEAGCPSSALTAVEGAATDSDTWELCVTLVLHWKDPLYKHVGADLLKFDCFDSLNPRQHFFLFH